MNVVAIIQARMGSTRLPGKVMRDLCGKTVLAHVIERVKCCYLLGEVIVATTDKSQDDIVAGEVLRCGVRCFRGSEDDVLGRYFHAAKYTGGNVIVRITSDCPLIDPDIISAAIRKFHELRISSLKIDYLSNSLVRTFPRGLDVEVFTFEALEKAHLEAKESFDREHVTPYIYQHPDMFCLHGFANHVDMSRHRWTLDTYADLDFIKAVYSALYRKDELFSSGEVYSLLKNKHELLGINAHIKQKLVGN